jgi:Domain of unknown function (DUF4365)
MSAPSQLDIESELSYAYLHAVASQAGMACRDATRLEDNAGIDAMLTAWGPFPDGGYLEEVDLKVQLKATIHVPRDNGQTLSYFVKGPSRYDALRAETAAIPRILVVLFLPLEREQWIGHSADELVLRKCAYWVSLRGARPPTKPSGATVELPKTQVLTPDNLLRLMSRLSRKDVPRYQEAL